MKRVLVFFIPFMLFAMNVPSQANDAPRLLSFCTDEKENSPSITSDGLTLFFHSDTEKGYGGEDIWYVRRNTIHDEWGDPANIGKTINTARHEWAPFISHDGLSLYFASDRSGGIGGYDMWVSTRESLDGEWGAPVNMGKNVNSRANEANPCVSKDETYLVFSDYGSASLREGGFGQADIWYSTRKSKQDEWGEAKNLGAVVNSKYKEVYPRLAMDDLIIFFSTDREGGYGDRDIWYSKRSGPNDDWQPPVNMGAWINSRGIDVGLIIFDEGNELIFVSDRRLGGGNLDIYEVIADQPFRP